MRGLETQRNRKSDREIKQVRTGQRKWGSKQGQEGENKESKQGKQGHEGGKKERKSKGKERIN
jgi:hypothetical protein